MYKSKDIWEVSSNNIIRLPIRSTVHVKWHSWIHIRPSEILIGPQDQIVTPGDTAYFICHAQGDSVYWYINNSDPHPQSIYVARGFSFFYNVLSAPSNGSEEHNNTIIVEARPSNNNTRIACTAVGSVSNQHAFQEGTLIIAGSKIFQLLILLS